MFGKHVNGFNLMKEHDTYSGVCGLLLLRRLSQRLGHGRHPARLPDGPRRHLPRVGKGQGHSQEGVGASASTKFR